MEADLYSRSLGDRSDLIDGVIGEESSFHHTFGYYAQGVGPATAILPRGWEGRLTLIENANTGGAKAYCIDPQDLALAKLVAWREKDQMFLGHMAQAGLIDEKRVKGRIALLPVDDVTKEQVQDRLERLLSESVVSIPAFPRPR